MDRWIMMDWIDWIDWIGWDKIKIKINKDQDK